jgi:hypothetical protein
MAIKTLKKNKLMILLIVLSVIPIMLAAGFMLKGIKDRDKYEKFIADFGTSLSFAQRKDILTAEYEGTTMHVIPKNGRVLFNIILRGSFHKLNVDLPDPEDALVLDFGIGDKMWIWPSGSRAVIIHYLRIDGEEFIYLTNEGVRFGNIEYFCSETVGNTVWEENTGSNQ